MKAFEKELKLKSGLVLKNRIGKSAMSENMGSNLFPNESFENCYEAWANGGVALSVTGNVMVDENHLGEPFNLVLNEKVEDLSKFKKWAIAGKKNNTVLFMQLNHPGKQSPNFLNKTPVSPSAISFPPPMNKMFNKPKELTSEEIIQIVNKFGIAAKKAMEAGFDGVQIHGAHGYLVSQFLSPKHNQRKDEYGGSIENRMRFLLEIIKKIQEQTDSSFGLGVKLNSADFQLGGFSEDDSMKVVAKLDTLGLDFIEISGGTYEVNAMMGKKSSLNFKKESTQKREAYFIDYAKKVRSSLNTPLMLTGGFRDAKLIDHALENNDIDIAGIARPFCVYPDLVNRFKADYDFEMNITPKKLGVRALDTIIPLEITWYTQQIHRLGKNKKTRPNFNVWLSAGKTIVDFGLLGLKRVRI